MKKRSQTLKRLKKSAAIVTLSSLCVYGAVNAVAATATMQIFARLVRAIEVNISTSMEFGTLAMTLDRSGKATIDPLVDKLFIDGNSSLIEAGGEPRAGRFLIKGSEIPVSVSIEDSVVQLTNGTTTLSINNFNLVTPSGGGHVTITPVAPGFSVVLPVGATLNTRRGQLTGSYVGTNRIFANYQ